MSARKPAMLVITVFDLRNVIITEQFRVMLPSGARPGIVARHDIRCQPLGDPDGGLSLAVEFSAELVVADRPALG